MRPRVSVVIRSKDEADRLRLTLASLICQSARPEVVVVNDGSSDHTKDVIAEAGRDIDIVALHNAKPIGRSAASNAGAAAATGEIVLFLDGDTLAAPNLVAEHLRLHRERTRLLVRGSTYHLRCTRMFLDPEVGTPQPGQEDRVARMTALELLRAIVTRLQIRKAFHEIDKRAQPGIYPGFGPRRLFEIEMDALENSVDCSVVWAAASGSNQSLARRAFLDIGGFHPNLSTNEHRELALRLCQVGYKMSGTTVRTYHMTHRSGWRDPLQDTDWEDVLFNAHPIAAVALLPLLWASLADVVALPEAARIRSLPELAAAAERCKMFGSREAVRAAHLRWAETGAVT
jgi:glycosyltransferase involved in cell wall biosynthesis